MQIIDWIFLFLPVLLVFAIGMYTRTYVKSVADFMSGGRLAGRYLLAIGSGVMQAGVVVFISQFEVIASSGFTIVSWWQWASVPVVVLVSIFGFVVYRFRETRALTLAQFLEIRYGRSFRLFTGVVGFLAGICNFGIIPAIGARFFVYFLGLPSEIVIHSFRVPTFVPVMALLLFCTVVMTVSGGIITVIITNCIEGIMSQLFYLVVIVSLVSTFRWPQISHVLLDRPAGHSLMNPFDIGKAPDFNIWYVLMGIFGSVYGTMAWQNASAYNSAPMTAHEGRMGVLLGRWREQGKTVVVALLAVCAMTFLAHPDFAARSQLAHAAINHVQDANTQRQMSIPIAISHMLPPGVKGMLCAIMIMGIFGGDSLHLHSWGGIFIQDVLAPLRKKVFTPAQHIRALRASIIGVAVFAFLFGSLFKQTEYVVMWWTVTMSIYIGGAGAAIIGGLYWKKGTTAAAWAAMITGSALSTGGVIARQVFGAAFPLNGVQVGFYAALTSIVIYVVVSLLTCKEDFNLNRMLHRGEYAVATPGEEARKAKIGGKQSWLQKLLGFDECFTVADKWIAGSLLGWSTLWCVLLVVGSVWNTISPWSKAAWSTYWHVTAIGLPIGISVVTGIWFTIGGIRDMRLFFRRLREEKIDPLDDGTVWRSSDSDELQEAGELEVQPEFAPVLEP